MPGVEKPARAVLTITARRHIRPSAPASIILAVSASAPDAGCITLANSNKVSEPAGKAYHPSVRALQKDDPLQQEGRVEVLGGHAAIPVPDDPDTSNQASQLRGIAFIKNHVHQTVEISKQLQAVRRGVHMDYPAHGHSVG